MKKTAVLTILAISTLCAKAQHPLAPSWLDITVYGAPIIPTIGIDFDQLNIEHAPWWGDSNLAEVYASGYAQALFNWAKYNSPSDVDHLPNVYFAFAQSGNFIDDWVFDETSGKMYENNGDNVNSGLLFADPPSKHASVPDTCPTITMAVMALGGLILVRRTLVKNP